MNTGQIRQRIRLQMAQTPPWVRDAVIGLLAGGIAVMLWTSIPSPAVPTVSTPVATPTAGAIIPVDIDAREAMAGPTGAPLLWKVSKGEATVYLFGSVHVLQPGLDWMDPRLFQAFDTADAAWFEVPDLDKLPHFKGFAASAMAARPVLLNGLDDVEKRELEILLNRYNYTLKDVERVKPWAMAAFVEDLSRLGGAYTVDRGADMTLFNRAVALKHRTGGFESHKEHYDYLYALGGDMGQDGTQALKQALANHFGRSHDGIDMTVKTWRTGDQKAMTENIMAEKTDSPRFYDLLLVQRNAKWVPQIETMLNGKETVFVTAGVAHFIGPDSVVAQLRKRGYKVERIDP